MTNHFTTDNRYSPGSSGGVVPLGAPAAYAARWIDHCTWADILPDRQGFAYNDRAGFQALVEHLVEANLAAKMPNVALDVTRLVIDDPAWCLLMRRAGGYVYVDAWLVPGVEACVHCGKPLHVEGDVLVDDTGGDVCGTYGTFGNEPHEVEA